MTHDELNRAAAEKAAKSFDEYAENYRRNNRTHHLPVDDPKHTEVLGSRVSSKYGKANWEQLDWSNWWIDHGAEGHLFSNANCDYFHVECKDKAEGCVYRVRCWYAGGSYRGWPVESVGIGRNAHGLYWIVRTKRPAPPDARVRAAVAAVKGVSK